MTTHHPQRPAAPCGLPSGPHSRPRAALPRAVLVASLARVAASPLTSARGTEAAPGGPLPAGARADYQLGGAYPPAPGVTVVARDSTEDPAPGLYNICYVNGFQTQLGEGWPPSLLVPGPGGAPLADPGWPDEYLLDISDSGARAANLERRLADIRRCAAKGFDAIEFDNLDSYTRSGGYLDIEDAVAFATSLVRAAAALGLPAGQKNGAELGARGRDEIGFRFAVAESCHRWGECAAYTGVYGVAQVIGIEYADDAADSLADACADPARPASLVLRDPLLTPAGQPGHILAFCPGAL
ncbi:MAG: endo alpha-1,4 polygalactosaminidase [Rubellimicrobium sp.]|nr:endo alpha-1,4 polygalactosaminidase [Rubellimicrobium sp.]